MQLDGMLCHLLQSVLDGRVWKDGGDVVAHRRVCDHRLGALRRQHVPHPPWPYVVSIVFPLFRACSMTASFTRVCVCLSVVWCLCVRGVCEGLSVACVSQ